MQCADATLEIKQKAIEYDLPEPSLFPSPVYIGEHDALWELLTEDPTEIISDFGEDEAITMNTASDHSSESASEKPSQSDSQSRPIAACTLRNDLELFINGDDDSENESEQPNENHISNSDSPRPIPSCSWRDDLEYFINSDHSTESDSELSDDASRPITPPDDHLSALTTFAGDECHSAIDFDLFSLEPRIESRCETKHHLHCGSLSPLATVYEAPENEPELHCGGADSETKEVENNGPSELDNGALEETCDASTPDVHTIAEFSEQWEIIAEWEREGYSACIALSNTNRYYWRTGDRYKALNSEELADLDNWWQACKPQPTWLRPEYSAGWELVPEDNTGIAPEGPTVVLSKDTSYDPDSSLPFTWHLNPKWSSHSAVDYYGQIYLIQKAKDEYLLSQGYRIAVGQVCKWVALSSPNLRRDTRQRLTATGQPVPELVITSPDGTVGWLDDFTYYNGERSWADLDSDDEEV